MSSANNSSVSSCIHSCCWSQRTSADPWIVRNPEDFYASQITAPDVIQDNDLNVGDGGKSRPLREKNWRKNSSCKHVPHREKPPQIVAKRNARERRRVQAVNNAFVRLRKAVPFENTRGKRISKVKTLKNAIEYIQRLQQVLQIDVCYQPYNRMYHYECQTNAGEYFTDDESEDLLY